MKKIPIFMRIRIFIRAFYVLSTIYNPNLGNSIILTSFKEYKAQCIKFNCSGTLAGANLHTHKHACITYTNTYIHACMYTDIHTGHFY